MGNLGLGGRLAATAVAAAVAAAVGTVPASASASAKTVFTVTATENIFGAGQTAVPPGTGGEGVLPTEYVIPSGAHALVFSATGTLFFSGTGDETGPAGRHMYGNGYSRISDPNHFLSTFYQHEQGPLVAVFTEGTPQGPPPPSFIVDRKAPAILPALDQVFYVGAGGQTVDVPPGATALYLGFADADDFAGPAGYYGDNSGQARVTVRVTKPVV